MLVTMLTAMKPGKLNTIAVTDGNLVVPGDRFGI